MDRLRPSLFVAVVPVLALLAACGSGDDNVTFPEGLANGGQSGSSGKSGKSGSSGSSGQSGKGGAGGGTLAGFGGAGGSVSKGGSGGAGKGGSGGDDAGDAGASGTGGASGSSMGGKGGASGSSTGGKGGGSGNGGAGGVSGKGGAGGSSTAGAGGDTVVAGAGGTGGASGTSGTGGASAGAGGNQAGAGGSGGTLAGNGGSAGNGGNGGLSGSGQGGSAGSNPGGCSPGAMRGCYDGAPGTAGVGLCKKGTQTCQPTAIWGACQNQVVPAPNDACDGVDATCDGNWNVTVPAICPTIQAALDASSSPKLTIPGRATVAVGTYGEDLVWKGSPITVRAAGDKAATVIKGTGKGSVVIFANGETASSRLEGFTITGGTGTIAGDFDGGGGIHIRKASPTLENLDVTGNTTGGNGPGSKPGVGGGIYVREAGPTLRHIRVFGNSSTYGGGGIGLDQSSNAVLQWVQVTGNKASLGGGISVYLTQGSQLTNVIVSANVASADGGGVWITSAASVAGAVAFTNLVLRANDAGDDGGGLWTSTGVVNVQNAIFASNTATDAGSATFVDGGSLRLTYSDVVARQGDAKPTHVGWSGPGPGDNDLTVVPGFVDVTGAALDWNLRLVDASPVRDKGVLNLKDADGTRSDMGAYGGPGSNGW